MSSRQLENILRTPLYDPFRTPIDVKSSQSPAKSESTFFNKIFMCLFSTIKFLDSMHLSLNAPSPLFDWLIYSYAFH